MKPTDLDSDGIKLLIAVALEATVASIFNEADSTKVLVSDEERKLLHQSIKSASTSVQMINKRLIEQQTRH